MLIRFYQIDRNVFNPNSPKKWGRKEAMMYKNLLVIVCVLAVLQMSGCFSGHYILKPFMRGRQLHQQNEFVLCLLIFE